MAATEMFTSVVKKITEISHLLKSEESIHENEGDVTDRRIQKKTAVPVKEISEKKEGSMNKGQSRKSVMWRESFRNSKNRGGIDSACSSDTLPRNVQVCSIVLHPPEEPEHTTLPNVDQSRKPLISSSSLEVPSSSLKSYRRQKFRQSHSELANTCSDLLETDDSFRASSAPLLSCLQSKDIDIKMKTASEFVRGSFSTTSSPLGQSFEQSHSLGLSPQSSLEVPTLDSCNSGLNVSSLAATLLLTSQSSVDSGIISSPWQSIDTSARLPSPSDSRREILTRLKKQSSCYQNQSLDENAFLRTNVSQETAARKLLKRTYTDNIENDRPQIQPLLSRPHSPEQWSEQLVKMVEDSNVELKLLDQSGNQDSLMTIAAEITAFQAGIMSDLIQNIEPPVTFSQQCWQMMGNIRTLKKKSNEFQERILLIQERSNFTTDKQHVNPTQLLEEVTLINETLEGYFKQLLSFQKVKSDLENMQMVDVSVLPKLLSSTSFNLPETKPVKACCTGQSCPMYAEVERLKRSFEIHILEVKLYHQQMRLELRDSLLEELRTVIEEDRKLYERNIKMKDVVIEKLTSKLETRSADSTPSHDRKFKRSSCTKPISFV